MSRRERFEDDGRTIADMSALGTGSASKKGNLRRESYPPEREGGEAGEQQSALWGERAGFEPPPFTWTERFRYMGMALGAALLIAFAFVAGLGLVIWLITLYG